MPYTESTSENTTTTTKDSCCSCELNLIFPKKIIPAQRQAITKMLSQYSDDAQAIIDELAGRMKIADVKNPVGYVKGILKNIGNEGFEPELGMAITDERSKFKNEMAENQTAAEVREKTEVCSAKENIQKLHGLLKKCGY